MRVLSVVVLGVLGAAVLAGPACARERHARIRYHSLHGLPVVPHYAHPGVIPDVLVTNTYGDVILDGTTGFHRSDFGVMVPDSEPPSVVAIGRARGSGLGANGVPALKF